MKKAVLLMVLSLGLAALPAASHAAVKTAAAAKTEKSAGIGPVEDLMREHGALSRILLVYEELARRIEAGKHYPATALKSANALVRQFVEEYHEKMEEEHIFPVFKKSPGYGDMVKVLRAQHRAGRTLADTIRDLSGNKKKQKQLAQALRGFVRVYRPHAAREDTVLYPALRALLQPRAFRALGAIFEDRELEYFGKQGFEKVMKDIDAVEKELGFYDLSQYSPK